MSIDIPADFAPIDYLATKGHHGKRGSTGEFSYACFFDCDEQPNSKKRKLYVNARSGFFWCHVCNAKGGTYLLLQHFGDAPDGGSTPVPQRSRVLEQATEVGQVMLEQNDEMMLYLLNERGLSPETIIERRLGYVGGNWSLVGNIRADEDDLLSSGLVHREGKRKGEDFFYNHLLIPFIREGRVMQIRGKVLSGNAAGRYMTGPGDRVRLYNEDHASRDDVVITEGEFDCYSGDTEVLTDRGWVRFDELGQERVAQYNEDGSLEMVWPKGYIEKESDLIRLSTQRNGGIDIVVSPGHRMVSTLADGTGLRIHRADEPASGRHHVPRAGVLDGPGIDHSKDELALLVAMSADASIDFRVSDGAQYARFGLSKERKVQRLLGLLDALGVEHSASDLDAYTSICFRVPNYLTAFKVFPDEWLARLTVEQREFLLDELVEWDGNRVEGRDQTEYSTSLEVNARWVQTLAHTSGRVATIIRRTNDHGEWRKVSILHSKRSTSWQSIDTTDAGRGTVYCVEVPSGMLLVRRAEQVLVSGNCMKLAEELALATDDRVRKYGVVGLSGANAFPEDLEQLLSPARRIFIALDPDTPGRAAAVRLKDMFGARARIVELPTDTPEKADWTWLLTEGGWSWRDAVSAFGDSSGKRVFTIHDAYESWLHSEGHQGEGLKTGYTELDDKILPGLLPGQLFVLLAKTGTGKTVWLCNLAVNMALEGRRVLFVSLEQTKEEVYERLQRVLRFHRPTASDLEVNDALSCISIVDLNRVSEQDFTDLIEEAEVETGHRPEVVMVDYLGYFARGVKGTGRYEKTSNAVMALKAAAKRERVVIVAPHQVSRMAKEGKPIDLDDARDSGVVEETADFLCSIYRPDDARTIDQQDSEPSGKLRMTVLKSRHGGKDHAFNLQMDLLTLAIVDDHTLMAKEAKHHTYLYWRGQTYEDLRREQTKPVQMDLTEGGAA